MMILTLILIFVLLDLDMDVYDNTYYGRIHEENRQEDERKKRKIMKSIHRQLKKRNDNSPARSKTYRRSITSNGATYTEEVIMEVKE